VSPTVKAKAGGRRANGPALAPETELPMQAQATSPRRERYERGIYRRRTPSGDSWEITFTDSDGRQRWRTIYGGLREARAARADVVSKLARGERVAPSKLTLAEIAETWLDAQEKKLDKPDAKLRRTTYERYATLVRLHILPCLGERRITSIDEDDVVALIAEMQAKNLRGATIRKALMVLGRILGNAERRGKIPLNPVSRLQREERPAIEKRDLRILEREEIAKLLDATPAIYRALIALSIFTGLRQGEALGLTWADVDLKGARLHVRKQLDRSGNRVQPKTPKAKREIALAPFLVRLLREHKRQALAVGHAKPEDFVFASQIGGPLHYRNVVRRGLDKAVRKGGLDVTGKPKLRWHDLRHTAASLLIAQGQPVTYVAQQLGHVSPDITLKFYADLFDHAANAERAREALEASFGEML
jgi:integrase